MIDFGDFKTLLKQGSEGEAVEAAQKALKKAGYDPGSIDGIYGPKTLKAVKQFQKDHSLAQDGELGPKTASALGRNLGSPKPAKKPTAGLKMTAASKPTPGKPAAAAKKEPPTIKRVKSVGISTGVSRPKKKK